jgi:hypothetical protein
LKAGRNGNGSEGKTGGRFAEGFEACTYTWQWFSGACSAVGKVHRRKEASTNSGKMQVKLKCGGDFDLSRSSLNLGSEFAGFYLNPNWTPEELARVSQAVWEMKKPNVNEDNSVQSFVTIQGVLVVPLEKGQQERRVFESASPWVAEAAAASAAMRSEGTWVQVTRRGVGRRTADERASTPSPQPLVGAREP